MKNYSTKLIGFSAITGLLAFSLPTSAQLADGEIVGIDFGNTPSTDPVTTWNDLSLGGDATTPGLSDNGEDPNTEELTSLLSTGGSAVPNVTFTFENSSGQIAFDFTTSGQVGEGLFTDATVFGDAIISNDSPNTGRPVEANEDTFILTFSNLNDSLDYNIVGGWSQLTAQGAPNNNFNAVWSADGQSFTTNANTTGYGSLSGLSTDGAGNLVITVTGIGPAAQITASGITLQATSAFDTDMDGILDSYEAVFFPGTGDGPDLTMLTATGDFDDDGLTDLEEFNLRLDFPSLSPIDNDSDDDGFSDGVEDNQGVFVRDADTDEIIVTGTNPVIADTDEDGLLDGLETDTGTFVAFETETGTDPLDADTDDDGLLDGVENNTDEFVSPTVTGTDPLDPNSDGDAQDDGLEVALGSDPNDGTVIGDVLQGYEAVGPNWLSAADFGSVDINGDGLGSDGFIFFGAFDGVPDAGEPFSENIADLPSYVTTLSEGSDFSTVASGFAGYGSIDDPVLLDGTDQLAGFALTGNVTLAPTNAGPEGGDSFEILTFTVSGVIPEETTIRVGVLGGVEAAANGRFDPSAITLTGPSTSETKDNNGEELGANPGGVNAGWVFFDISEDGTFSVSSTRRTTGTAVGTGIGGLTFDSIGDFNPPVVPSLEIVDCGFAGDDFFIEVDGATDGLIVTSSDTLDFANSTTVAATIDPTNASRFLIPPSEQNPLSDFFRVELP